VVEVPELDLLERAFADTDLEQQVEGEAVAAVVEARIACSWSFENVVRSTPRFFGGRIGRAGSPCRRPDRVAHSKKPLRTLMFFACVRGAEPPHSSSMNSSRRSRVSRARVGSADRVRDVAIARCASRS
jgi:hypothetical protein